MGWVSRTWWGEIFHTHPGLPQGPLSFLYGGHWVYSTGVKHPGHSFDHPPPSSAKVKEMVQVYLFSPLCAFIAC